MYAGGGLLIHPFYIDYLHRLFVGSETKRHVQPISNGQRFMLLLRQMSYAVA